MQLNTYGNSKNPPALFLHGYGAHPKLYKKFIERMSAQHHVYVPEIFGLSNICRRNFSDNLDPVRQLMRDKKLTSGTVVGHSYGALAALHLASEFPDLKSSIAINPLLPGIFSVPKIGLQVRNVRRDLFQATGELRGMLLNPHIGATYSSNVVADVLGYVRGAAEALITKIPLQKSPVPTKIIYADLDTLFHIDEADLTPWRTTLPNISFHPIQNYSHNWVIYHGDLAHERIFA